MLSAIAAAAGTDGPLPQAARRALPPGARRRGAGARRCSRGPATCRCSGCRACCCRWRPRPGRRCFLEGFPDRGYAADGRLLPRSEPGALVEAEDADRRAGARARGARSTRCACTATARARSSTRAPYAVRSRARVTNFTVCDGAPMLTSRRAGPMVLRVTTTRAALSAAALVPVLLSIGACSASVSAGSDKEYDADKVAGLVQDAQEKATPDLDVSDATCPDDVELKRGRPSSARSRSRGSRRRTPSRSPRSATPAPTTASIPPRRSSRSTPPSASWRTRRRPRASTA